MSIFHFLKNGITVEKKKVQPETTEPEDLEATDNEPEAMEPTQAAASEPVAMPSAQQTLEEQRMEAASVLLGDNGLTHGATPSLIQVDQPAPIAQPIAQPTPIETPVAQPIFNTHNNTSGNFDNALLGQVSANQNLLVIAPQNSAEISTILTNLANGNACIVSLAKFSLADGQRFLDYICGFVNAIGGMIMQKSASEYILAPKGVNIKNS